MNAGTKENAMPRLGSRLSAETDCEEQCEGLVVTCAHCGRPATECDGTDCDDLLETRDWMLPSYSRGT